MLVCIAVISLGLALRQADRLHFARSRPHAASSAQLVALQRERTNNVTPALLLAGQWVQIAGWWMLAAHGPLGALLAALAVSVHFRHLQEISHFAVHGVLVRSRRLNLLLAEVFAHQPLALGPVELRQKRHVRDHHPHATLDTDPNLAELRHAGLRPGVTGRHFAVALAFPLSPRGFCATLRSIVGNLSGSRASYVRLFAPAAMAGAAYVAGGSTAALFGVLIPRLFLYPQLAWLSLVNEHTWFDPDPRTGPRAHIEAGRCLRLYPTRPALAAVAALTWLPYGDLHHYAHSAHPAIRWNYLPALERHLTTPHFTPNALFVGSKSVARRHRAALSPTATHSTPQLTGAAQ
ncbi:fatty acid desaturase [Streptomyces sp. NPDC050095]|uniref:fatty acid desaturase n=1 Tax=unclassified Streptomyces TaxID=2593676 RepID=UPI0034193661